MREMKDSGVAWIGEIPETWETVRFKDHYKNKKEIAGEHSSEFERLALTLNGVIKRPKDDSEGLQPKEFDTYQILRENDFVFKMIDLQNISTSRVGLSPYTGLVSPAYIRFTSRKENQFNKFTYYFLMSMYYNCVFNSLGGDGVRSALNASDMGTLMIPNPNLTTQQKIAAHLDRKCTQIDALISNAQQQIEKLKALRDAVLREVLSEGANITDICREQYTTTKMGSIGTYKKGPFGSSLKKSMFVPKGEKTFKVYEQKNAIYKNATLGYYYISEEKFNELKSFEICPGDIIISCAGTIGECYEIPVDAEKGVINQALMYVRLNKDMDTLFFTYLFEFVIKSISLTDSNGSAMKNIPPFDKIKPFVISIPSTKENQHKLAEYIQKKIKTITDLAEIKQKKIEKLQQYKKSLIYEYVTGKKEV